MNKTAAALVTIAATFALAGPSIADETPVACPPDAPGNLCVENPPAEQCTELNNFCQQPDAATLLERNRELRHQVEVLEYQAALLRAKVDLQKVRIRLLRARLQDARAN
ncbi:MAG TPA: hypothetical protein VJ782_01875 [Aeromicrobium sp.]|nr:hypothetical protein [Aeromicrobium sp.]